jgi:hypothetical protein
MEKIQLDVRRILRYLKIHIPAEKIISGAVQPVSQKK